MKHLNRLNEAWAINSAVAEYIFGYTNIKFSKRDVLIGRIERSNGEWAQASIPDYCNDISLAWEVHKHIYQEDSSIEIQKRYQEYTSIEVRPGKVKHYPELVWPEVYGYITPSIICRAALRALNVEWRISLKRKRKANTSTVAKQEKRSS